LRVTKAVIPAAGLGVRFLPATKAQPKEMLPVVDKPVIQYIVEEAVESGIENILIVTGQGKKSIEDHFDKSQLLEEHLQEKGKVALLNLVREISEIADLHYVRQKEPRGLGHAIYCARRFVGDEPFAVLLGDDLVRSEKPCLKQLLELYDEVQSTVLAVKEVPAAEVNKYGILDADFLREGVYYIRDLVEKPPVDQAPSRLAIMGRYVISPSIFPILENTPPGQGGEIQLTDALKVLSKEEPLYGINFEGRRYDVGDKLGYLMATVEFALDYPELGKDFESYLKQLVSTLG